MNPTNQRCDHYELQLYSLDILQAICILYWSPSYMNVNFNFDILQAICTEAGLLALRERRMKVTNEDFKKAKENVLYRKNEGTPDGLYL